MDERKVYWHEPFVRSVKLTLDACEGDLSFVSEHRLSEEALAIDILIIKKNRDVAIEKDIGRMFRKFNVVEYKSEDDSLSVGDFHKVVAYAMLYSSFEGADISEMTATFAVTKRPKKLLRHLESFEWLRLRSAYDGITYIEGLFFPVQLVEIQKLAEDENIFIRGLRRGNSAEDLLKILKRYSEKHGLDMRDIYIDRLVQANREAFKEVMSMGKSAMELFLEYAEEFGWLEELENKAAAAAARKAERVTARETATRLLGFGDPIEKISIATQLPAEEIMELAREADTGLLA